MGYKDGTEYISNNIPFDTAGTGNGIYFKRLHPEHPDNPSKKEGYFLFISSSGYYGIQLVFPYWGESGTKIYFRRKNYYGFTSWVPIIDVDN